MLAADLKSLTALASLLPHIATIEARRGGNPVGNFETYFPDTGPYRRELYPQQMQFLSGGRAFSERLFMAANRVGKTETGAYEMTAHMTGLYPTWWEGRRFKGPIEAWMAGDTGATTRDIIQRAMLGPFGQLGAGMVPSHLLLGSPTRRHGIPEAYDSFWVRHVPTGGVSKGWFKSYDQRRQAFQGTSKHIVWLDEEPDDDGGIYAESVTRTMVVDDGGEKTSGIVYVTATPLRGLSIFIKEFMEKGVMHTEDGGLFNAEEVWSSPEPDGDD